MNNIAYKELIFDEKKILQLYLDNNWTNYTSKPKILLEGIKNSLYTLGAYDGISLVGLIRLVGDSNTIIYIQDILVLTKYQNKGIGTELLNIVLKKYQDVRQIILTTDNSETQKSFYEKNNFSSFDDLNLIGFIQKK